ncbi:heparinase II/III domain-containing protein [Streptomyces litchfieldiae]|uniref:Heparinase II/III family protein n=1 Tax=Streptomyces litchfieldiae TaxID=3075543 RepID=A0ABU2MXG6_9ACTN|nr:heparinase II/III family protein [Streptomyces sp. DSM 44938]MDT0346340.1 heparinase II/III family protein [Streptomyces sp. DSM 44938]
MTVGKRPPAAGALATRLRVAPVPAHEPDPLAGARRGLPVPPVTDRAVWDAVDSATRDGLLRLAAAELARPAPAPRASDWARAFRDGVRTAWEDPARELRERVALLTLAAVLTGERADAGDPPGAAPHLDAAADGMVALAEASTWCWAPHDAYTAARGEVLPDPDRPYLDLGAAEVAALLAWADHALGPHLDERVPGLRRRLRREVTARVLDPFRDTRDWPWLGLTRPADNWNAWIHSAVLAAALLLVEDAAERAGLVRLVVEGLDRFVATLPDDGGIDEGVAYWWLGAGRLLETLDLLAAAGPGVLDARDLPVLAELSRFPHRMHLGGPWYVNAGDAPARLADDRPWHLLHRWGRRLGDARVTAHAVARGAARPLAVSPGEGLGSALAGLADADWRAARAAPAPDAADWLAADVWLPRVQVLVARERAGTTDGLTLAAKAGHNAERHNHLDVGTYWVALDGRPVVVDVGQPTYTAASFGPDRYTAWPLRSAWHNVPTPGDADQAPGAGHAARAVTADLAPGATELRADLAAAYPEGLLTSWPRTLRLVRAAAGRPAHVLIEDAWTPDPGPVRLRHVLAGDVRLGPDHALVTAAPGRVLRIGWDPAAVTAELTRRELTDPLLRRSWGDALTRLTLTAVTGAPVRVRMERAR